jgi:hypothetical protein
MTKQEQRPSRRLKIIRLLQAGALHSLYQAFQEITNCGAVVDEQVIIELSKLVGATTRRYRGQRDFTLAVRCCAARFLHLALERNRQVSEGRSPGGFFPTDFDAVFSSRCFCSISSDGPVGNRVVVLHFSAHPRGSAPLLDSEFRDIDNVIRASPHREAILHVPVLAVRKRDLALSLSTYRPAVVHVSAHGTRLGTIALEDDGGFVECLEAKALKALLSSLGYRVRLVLLNACHSSLVAKELSSVVDVAIGYPAEVNHPQAIALAASFYGALAAGRSCLHAFEAAKNGTSSPERPGCEHRDPQMFCRRSIKPAKILFF